ncbi:hypothetical protein [Desulfovibrio legallii]|uniref:hypothetical protein n=1 Tax=Desulfovibrio legallii TaxID=571438 RepID=UPI0022E8A9F2|nr:hypothetical protein [Desulfovibrio legallii]
MNKSFLPPTPSLLQKPFLVSGDAQGRPRPGAERETVSVCCSRALPEQYKKLMDCRIPKVFFSGSWHGTTGAVAESPAPPNRAGGEADGMPRIPLLLEHVTLEMLAYGRQKPAFSHFVARIFKKILAEQLAHFIR